MRGIVLVAAFSNDVIEAYSLRKQVPQLVSARCLVLFSLH